MRREIRQHRLSVIVLHHWEFFDGSEPRESMLDPLHRLADWLDAESEVEVLRFSSAREHLRW